MPRRSAPQKTIDERAFPVRVRFEVPGRGLGNELVGLQNWLAREIGQGDYAIHGSNGLGVDAMAVHLRDVDGAKAMVSAFPDLFLADGTLSTAYSSPAQEPKAWTGSELFGVCNLYSLSKGQAAINEMVKVWDDRTGNMPPMTNIYPDYAAPVVTQTDEGRVMSMMRWGMPSPAFALKNRSTDSGVTNVRNAKSPHWRQWLTKEHRCIVPFTAFSKYEKTRNQKPELAWFAMSEDEPLAFFAGIWTNWTSVRKLKEGETTNDLFAFLTTEPNAEVAAVHPKAMPVILTKPDEIEAWLTADNDEAMELQRPLRDEALRIVGRGRQLAD